MEDCLKNLQAMYNTISEVEYRGKYAASIVYVLQMIERTSTKLSEINEELDMYKEEIDELNKKLNKQEVFRPE